MAFAVTAFRAYGLPVSEPGEQNFVQVLELQASGTTADVVIDLGTCTAGSLGTFWTAAGGAGTGATALAVFQDILLSRAQELVSWSCWDLAVNFKPAGGAAVGAGLVKMSGTELAPVWTLNATEGLTSYKFCLKYKLSKDCLPVRYGV